MDSTQYDRPYMYDNNTQSKKQVSGLAYCVLPYHPVWLKLPKSVAQFCDDVYHHDMLACSFPNREVPKIAVSWKQTASPFAVGLVSW